MTTTTIHAIEVLNTMTVKQLYVHAEEIGAIVPKRAKKAVVISNIVLEYGDILVREQSERLASEPKASEPSNADASSIYRNPVNHQSENAIVIDDADEFFELGDADHEPAIAVNALKRIEFVKGTNLAVQFKYNGKLVIIGWSRSDYKMHSWSEISNKAMLTSYATQMKFFKKLKNGLDGDVAQVVKALVRIKAMPAEIKVLQRKATRSDDQNVSGRRVEENGRIRRGVVDADVMNVFVGMYAEAMDVSEADVRKNGRLILNYVNAYAVNTEMDIEDFTASYISDIYNAMSDSE